MKAKNITVMVHSCQFFPQVTTDYPIGPLINILMASEDSHTCSVRLHGVSENATFVIDLDELSFGDLCSDDLGSCKATTTKCTYFRITSAGIWISEKPPASAIGKYFMSTRQYYAVIWPLYRKSIRAHTLYLHCATHG